MTSQNIISLNRFQVKIKMNLTSAHQSFSLLLLHDTSSKFDDGKCKEITESYMYTHVYKSMYCIYIPDTIYLIPYIILVFIYQ